MLSIDITVYAAVTVRDTLPSGTSKGYIEFYAPGDTVYLAKDGQQLEELKISNSGDDYRVAETPGDYVFTVVEKNYTGKIEVEIVENSITFVTLSRSETSFQTGVSSTSTSYTTDLTAGSHFLPVEPDSSSIHALLNALDDADVSTRTMALMDLSALFAKDPSMDAGEIAAKLNGLLPVERTDGLQELMHNLLITLKQNVDPSHQAGVSLIERHRIEDAGLDWADVSAKLIANGWADQMNADEVCLKEEARIGMVKAFSKTRGGMSKAFGKVFDKVAAVLQQPNIYVWENFTGNFDNVQLLQNPNDYHYNYYLAHGAYGIKSWPLQNGVLYFNSEGYNFDQDNGGGSIVGQPLINNTTSKKDAITDFDLELTCSWKAGMTDCPYGFIIGQDAKNCYGFFLSGDGSAGAGLLRDNKWGEPPIGWNKVSAAKQGKNLLKLEVRRNLMTYYVNGEKVGAVANDAKFACKYYGLYVFSRQSVCFNNLWILNK